MPAAQQATTAWPQRSTAHLGVQHDGAHDLGLPHRLAQVGQRLLLGRKDGFVEVGSIIVGPPHVGRPECLLADRRR